MTDWQIIEQIPEKKQELAEVQNAELSVGENSNATLAVRQSLEKKWYWIDKLLDMAIEVAELAITHPRWEWWADYWKRLKAIELMMEASGYVKRKNWMEVKFSLSKFLYNN